MCKFQHFAGIRKNVVFRKKNPKVITRKILKSDIPPMRKVLEVFFEKEVSLLREKNKIDHVATEILSWVNENPPFSKKVPEIETDDLLFEINLEARIIFVTHLYSGQETEWIYFDDFVQKINVITSQ